MLHNGKEKTTIIRSEITQNRKAFAEKEIYSRFLKAYVGFIALRFGGNKEKRQIQAF